MPLFYFHVFDGNLLLDDQGLVLPDLTRAKVHAIRGAVHAFIEMREQSREHDGWLMEVADEHNLLLLRVNLDLIDDGLNRAMKLRVTPGRRLVN